MEIADKIIVVTGAASGIGKAMAERFHAEGAKQLVVADLDAAGAQKVADSVGGVAMALDVSSEPEVINLIERTENQIGPIDLFCSNAGISLGTGLDEPFEVWQKIWEVNTLSHLYAARNLIPRMKARGGGYLLNTASAAGLLTHTGSVTYAVTKHAAVALAEWIAITYGRDGIKVSVLCPQGVRTAMTADQPGVSSVDGMMEADDVAGCVVEALRQEQFLVLPHPQVADYIKRKASDYDRWLHGMSRLQEQFNN